MDENGKLKLRYTWPVIILFWILFWPVGLTLTCFRVSFEKPGLRGAMVLDVIGFFWYFVGALMMILLLTDEGMQANDKAALVFCFAVGVGHQLIARRKRKKIMTIESYMPKSSYQGNARNYTTVQSSENVKANDFTDSLEKEEKSVPKKTAPPKMGKRTVVCENCGAANIVQSVTAECEYCGSLLK